MLKPSEGHSRGMFRRRRDNKNMAGIGSAPAAVEYKLRILS
jgi:hypothetical protein